MRTLGQLLAVVVAMAIGVPAAGAATLTGTVFFDRDGNGVFSAGDDVVPGARVAWETSVMVQTDAAGVFALPVGTGAAGIAWVSVPEGGVPGPRWQVVTSAQDDTVIDFAVPPLAGSTEPFTFVVASDAHMDGLGGLWTPDDMAAGLYQALAAPTRFFTVVGDITQANRPEDFAAVDDALSELSAPWVPVAGNHDWYDGGAAYRAKWGPDSYSFTTGGVHFIVWNSAMSASSIGAFVGRDLAGRDPAMTVVAMGHTPPEDALAASLRAAGVDFLFTGHWHANRVVDHDGMIEFNTQPFVMGGIDLSPAGYRTVAVAGGALQVDHHSYVDVPVVKLTWPAERCVPPDTVLQVSVELGPGLQEVVVRDGARTFTLDHAGGWQWRGRAAGLTPGTHQVQVVATANGVEDVTTSARFEVCADRAAGGVPALDGRWPQQQGGPEHRGASLVTSPVPLETLWVASVGGNLHQGSPVVADGTVFVSIADFGAGSSGGVVALALGTGEERWRAMLGRSVRNSPAVDGGVVVVATDGAGIVALDAGTGAARWEVDLGEGIDATQSALWAAPTIRDGTVYVGTQRRMAAIDLQTGELRWSADPCPECIWLGSFAAAAASEELVLGTFARTSGLTAWARADGAERWKITSDAVKAMNGAPVIVDDRVLLGNVWGNAVALDLATGAERWVTTLTEGGHDWAYAVAGNPAYADGRFFVPTQWGELCALDADSGDALWSYDARTGALRSAHYRGVQPGFQGSPVVTGDVVWIADASGLLVALRTSDGKVMWEYDLGVPMLGGLAVAGEILLIPTFDGMVRAMVPAADAAVPPPASGCCRTGRGSPGDLALILGVLAWSARARRRARLR